MPRLTSFSQSAFVGLSITRSFDPAWTLSSVTKAFNDNYASSNWIFRDTTYMYSWVDMQLSSNGEKLYVLGRYSFNSLMHVFEYNLATAYDLTTISYVDKFSVQTQDTAPAGIFFKSDGTKMYMLGDTGNAVYQYSLSTAWDISTTSYDSVSYTLSDTSPDGIFFKSDGTVMYVLDSAMGAGGIRQYSLSTAWDISTASSVTNTGSVISSYLGGESCFCMSSDGTKVYVGGQAGVDAYEIHEFTLSTAWDVSSISYTSVRTTTDTEAFGNYYTFGLSISSDGTKLFVLGSNGGIYSLALSTAKDLSTSVFDGDSGYFGYDARHNGIFFKPDGTKLYTASNLSGKILEWPLSTAWDVTSAGISSEFNLPTAVSPNSAAGLQDLYISPDGTKLFTIHDGADLVFGFDLSTAWDITTASFNGTNKIDPAHNQAKGLFFKPDGTKAFFMDYNSSIRMYNLSTAWDLTTAVYAGAVSGGYFQDQRGRSFTMNSDGTKLFLVGFSKGGTAYYWPTVTEYDISNPWNPGFGTITYSNRYYDLTFMMDEPAGIYVDPNGEKMFITSTVGGRVYKFNLI